MPLTRHDLIFSALCLHQIHIAAGSSPFTWLLIQGSGKPFQHHYYNMRLNVEPGCFTVSTDRRIDIYGIDAVKSHSEFPAFFLEKTQKLSEVERLLYFFSN